MTTAELLAESLSNASKRERTAFTEKAGERCGRVVLVGAGTLGRKICKSLQERGTPPIAFADRNSGLDGSSIEGVKVFSLDRAASTWGRTAAFVVSSHLPFGDDGVASRIEHLQSLGCLSVLSWVVLSWQLENVLPHFGATSPSILLAHRDRLSEVNELWSDGLSRETFQQQLHWRLTGDFAALRPTHSAQYFPEDVLKPVDRECFVDGGAFDGDTLRAVPWKIQKAWAIEPDPFNIAKFRAPNVQDVKVFATALGNQNGVARFRAAGTTASARDGKGEIEVPVSRLDDLLRGERPTYIKLDVEGDELAALHGAEEILKTVRPSVAVCIYHKPEDFWTIPLYLKSILPDHGYFLRAHANDGFELVVYAIAPARSAS